MPKSRQMQELKDKVQILIDKYEERLTSAGVKITVSKRYFEIDVHERTRYSSNDGVLSVIDRSIAQKRERKYKRERNKYHCIILSVLPIDQTLVQREYCKEYAFVLRKVERPYIGKAPERFTYREDKLLSKIEKRILKVIKKAENRGVQKTCKDAFPDAIRYFSSKYEYKGKVLGKERSSWDLIFALMIVMLTIVILFAVRIISNLF